MDTVSETRAEADVQEPQEQASEATEVQEQASEGQATEARQPEQESSQTPAQPDIAQLLANMTDADLRRIPKLQSLLDKATEADRLKGELATIQRQLEENQRRQQREYARRLREQAKGLDPDAKAEQYDRLLQEQEFLERVQDEKERALSEAQQQWQQAYSQAIYSYGQKHGLTVDEIAALAQNARDYDSFWGAVTDAVAEKKLAKERERLAKEAEELAEARLKAKENDARAARDAASRGPLTTDATGPSRVDFSRMSDDDFAKYMKEYEANPDAFRRKYFNR